MSNKNGMTPLMLAIAYQNSGLAQLLRRNGAEEPMGIENLNDGLLEALKNKNPDKALFYIEIGADSTLSNEYGDTPLHMASFKGFSQVVSQLISKDANVNAAILRGDIGATPLHLAAMSGSAETVKILLENGADVSAKLGGNIDVSTWGATPLHKAATDAKPDVIKLLVEYGAVVDARDGHGCTPLAYAANMRRYDNADILVSLGADRRSKDNYGRIAWVGFR